jgi:predicted AAA+ superfamily ATPase
MYNRLVFQDILKRLKEPRSQIQVLLGPRQVGKTTGIRSILQQLALDGTEHRFAAADDPTLRDRVWLEQQWLLARAQCRALGSPFILVIDEVQKIEEWSEVVKKLWDEDSFQSLDLRVVLLGSSTLLIRKGLTESLAGRFEINPITHWPYSEIHNAFGYTWEEWVYFGVYPGSARLKNDPERWASYIRDSLIDTTISRDILSIERVDKPALLRRLFELGCRYSGQILSFQKMLGQLQEAGNASTLANYLELLSQAGLLTGISKYSGNLGREKASSPKLQILNPALSGALSSTSFIELCQNADQWGRAVESAVGAHLANAIVGKNMTLHYWRDRNLEVDFVLKKGEDCVAFEIKSGAKRESLPGMKAFTNKFAPVRTWVVGDSYGLSFSEFFMTPVESWWK